MERTPEKKVLNVGDCDRIACKDSGEWFGHKILAYFVDGNDGVGRQLDDCNLSDYGKPEGDCQRAAAIEDGGSGEGYAFRLTQTEGHRELQAVPGGGIVC